MKLLSGVLLVATLALTAFGQAAPPAGGLSGFQSAQLLTPTTGWIAAGGHVRWTSTGGASWQDITPSASSEQTLASMFFLDADAGWALLTSPPDSNGQQAASIASTTTGGSGWSVLPFSVSEPAPESALPAGSASIFFADASHGWITVRFATESNSDAGALYATSDGGQNWNRLPDPPMGDPVRFVSAQFGWQAGGAGGQQLYVTTNGGNSWLPVAVAIPGGLPIKRTRIADPVFSSPAEGLLPIELVLQNDTSVMFAYATQDGGQTWNLRSSVGTSAHHVAPGAVTDSLVVWAYAGEHQILVTDGSGTVTAVYDPWLFPRVVWTGFADRQHGWLVASAGGCNADKTNCWQRQKLLLTADGGVTVTDITPK
jgi:photosystem II stability/assembly factor-like uncharacterized protein